MSQIAKLVTKGRSQAVRLPAGCQFDADEVFIHRDESTGDVVLSRRPPDWHGFLEAVARLDAPNDFLSKEERLEQAHFETAERDPLDLCSDSARQGLRK